MKNKVIIKQDLLTDCGAACIYSIVINYDGYVPLETILIDTNTNKNGTNFYEMIKALNKYGFEANGYKIKYQDLLKEKKPVIIHTNIDGFEHFMVIYKIGKKVLVMDPKYGKKLYTKEYLKKIYTGKLIKAIPNTKIIKYKKNNTFIKSMIIFIKKNKLLVITNYIFSAILLIFGFIYSFYIKYLNKTKYINKLTIIFIILIIIEYIILYVKNIINIKLNIKLDKDLKTKLFNMIFNIKKKYILNKRVGEIIGKINKIDEVRNLLINILFVNIPDILIIIIALLILYNINRLYIVSSSIFIFINIIISIIFLKKIYYKTNNSIDSNNEYFGTLNEYLKGIETIQNINKEDVFINKLTNKYNDYQEMEYSLNKTNNTYLILNNLIEEIFYILITTYTIILIKNNYLNWSYLIIINSIIAIINSRLNSIISNFPNVLKCKKILRECNEFMNLPKDKNSTIEIDFKYIKINNLNYTYNHYNKVLSNINLTIYKGDKLLLTGNSGAGKSTFVKCISNILDDYEGIITINDLNIKCINNKTVKSNIVYISQNEKLFVDTIRNNIDIDKSNKDINNIYKICMLNKFIDEKPLKDDTLIFEDETNISKGEKARIVLARALLRKPKVLIIDEILSSISIDYEDKIINNLLSMKDLTLIYITHRNKNYLFKKVINLER